nr:terminase gpA endonuclease subunit [Escherichia coli]
MYNRFTLTPEGDEPLPGAVHFPNNPDIFDLTEAQQLTAEEQVEKWVDGRKKILWDSKKRRNEALDCFVYALARCASVFPAGSWISVHCWRACRKRMVQQPTRKHWQNTPVPYPERMNDATGRTCRCPCGTA